MNVDGQETQNAAPVDGVAEQAAPQEAAAELNINDLNAMKVIIDIASSRGAFKPNEMTAVGQTYTKLTNFLEQVAKQSEGAKQ
jgi:hypothetical protein